jgi:hypothetical protein
MDKQITLVIPGTGEEAEARDAQVAPGTTAADLLRAAGKNPQEWQLQVKRGDSFTSLSDRDDVSARANEGEKVFAVPKNMVVG